MLMPTSNETITPTDQETQLARTSSEALAPLLEENGKGCREVHVHFDTQGSPGADILLPPSAVRLLLSALQELAKGHSVTLLPVDTELSTQQAAELLRVSRPSLIKMLDDKKLPYRKVGAHRRIRYEDILAHVEKEKRARKEVLKELMAEQERLGLYE